MGGFLLPYLETRIFKNQKTHRKWFQGVLSLKVHICMIYFPLVPLLDKFIWFRSASDYKCYWCQSPHFVKSHSLKTFSTFQTRNKISQRTERFSTNKRGNKFFISRKETSLKIKVYYRVVLPVSCCYIQAFISCLYYCVLLKKFWADLQVPS